MKKTFMVNTNLNSNYLWNIVRRRKYWLVGLVCLNLALTYLVLRSPLFPTFYESSAVLYIEQSDTNIYINPQIFFDTPDLKTYVVVKHGSLYPSKLEQLTTLTFENYNRRIHGVVQRNGNVLITVHDESPQRAYDIVCTIVDVISEKVKIFSMDLKVISNPQIASFPIPQNYFKSMLLVAVLTLLFSMVWFFLYDTFCKKSDCKNK